MRLENSLPLRPIGNTSDCSREQFVGLRNPVIGVFQHASGLRGMTQPAMDHRQESEVPGAGLEDLVRLFETLQGFLVSAGAKECGPEGAFAAI